MSNSIMVTPFYCDGLKQILVAFQKTAREASNGNTPQVISIGRHPVKPWFQKRLPFDFNVLEADAVLPDTMLRGTDSFISEVTYGIAHL
jgi:hypothetical protein